MKKQFLDLGRQPIANKFLKKDEFKDEFFFDLKVVFDKDTNLVSLKDFVKPASAQKGKSQNKGTELLIMNYQLENKKEKTKNIEHKFWG